MRRKRAWLATMAMLLAASGVALARTGTATINGLVLGPDDKPVPHAAVTYQSAAGLAPHAVHTDAHGRFSLKKLPEDSYNLRASANGIFSEWEKNFALRKGQTREITLRLIYAREMPKIPPKKKPKKSS